MKKNNRPQTIQTENIVEEFQPSQSSTLSPKNKSYEIIDFVLLALLAMALVFLRSKFLKIPMERDEGVYILFGKQLLEGKIPYIDFFDTRLPLLYYVYGFVALFGTTLAQTATVFMVVQLITTWLIYWIAKNAMGRVGAFVAAFSYIFLSLAPTLNGFARQSEHFVNLFVVVGLYFLFQIKEIPTKKIISAGLFLCLAMMVKHNAVTVLIFGGLYLLIEFYNPEKFLDQRLIKAILLFSAGVLGVIIVLFGSIMLRGATNEMFYWAFVHSGLYASRVGFSDGLSLFENNMTRFLNEGYDVFFYTSLLGLLLIWLTKISSKAKLQWSLLYLFAFLAIVPGFQFYAHYFLMWVLVMAFFVGWAVVGLRDMIEEYIPQVPSKLQAIIPIILFISGFAWHFSNLKQYYLTPKYTQILRSAYGANPFPESVEIADYLKQHIQKGEALGVFGSEQQLFLYTDTKPASKHTIMYHLVSDSTRTEKTAIWQKEYIKEVEDAKPNYFVRVDQGTSLMRDTKSPILIFNWLDNYLNQNYERVGVVDIFSDGTVYKWDTEASNYKPQSTEVIYVMKRKKQ